MNIIFTFFIVMFSMHPIHLSKCQMEVNSESQRCEITLHVYIDDLQEAIQRSGSPELFLATKNEITDADSFIHDYITQHLVIMNGEKVVTLNWVGKEQSDDLLAFWCFVETEPVSEDRGLAITNSILQDLYDDQQNILNVIRSNGDEEYFLCRKGDEPAKIK